MKRLKLLTQSSLQTLQVCEEKFRLRYLEGLVPFEEAVYFAIGRGFHKAMEEKDPEAGVRALWEERGEPWGREESFRMEVDGAVIYAMADGALNHWSNWGDLEEEVHFQIPIRNPKTGAASTVHRFSGIMDGLSRERDALQELKTSSRVDRDYIQRLEIDFQVTSYLAAASELLGRPVRDVSYRIVKKPGSKRRKGETDSEYRQRVEARKPLPPLKQRKTETDSAYRERSRLREENRPPLARKFPETHDEYLERLRADYVARPDHYFTEVQVSRTDADIERWKGEIWRLHQRVLELENGSFPIRNTRACLDFGRCIYFDLCTGAVGPESFDVSTDVHPELPKLATPEGQNE